MMRFCTLFLEVSFCINFIYLAKKELKKKSKHPQDNRLSKREFRQFVTLVADSMPGADSFEYFIEFLNNSVEVSLKIFLRNFYAGLNTKYKESKFCLYISLDARKPFLG